MAFLLTIGPKRPIDGVEPTTVSAETAVEAWTLVKQMDDNSQSCEIKLMGETITWQALRDLAAKEAPQDASLQPSDGR